MPGTESHSQHLTSLLGEKAALLASMAMPNFDPKLVSIRSARAEDEPFLWQMLYEASHSGEEGTELGDVVANPALAVYVEHWGKAGDVGVIAEVDGVAIGAAWVRCIRAYGFVSDDIPELAVAVRPGFEGGGIGSALMTRLAKECASVHPAISLSVREDNPAVGLYRRLGYKEVEGRRVTNRVGGGSLLLMRSLTGDSSE